MESQAYAPLCLPASPEGAILGLQAMAASLLEGLGGGAEHGREMLAATTMLLAALTPWQPERVGLWGVLVVSRVETPPP